MMDLIQQLNSLTPLGLAAGLAFIIYQQVEHKKGQNKIANNHLHGLPEMAADIKEIALNMRELNRKIDGMGNDISYMRGRINGHDK